MLLEWTWAANYFQPSAVSESPEIDLWDPELAPLFPSGQVAAFSVWVYMRSSVSYDQRILNWGTSKTLLWAAGDSLKLESAVASISVTPGSWTYIRVRCGVGTTEVGTDSNTQTFAQSTAGIERLGVGGTPTSKFNGFIRELKVFNSDFSLTQLAYFARRKSDPVPTVTYALDEGTGEAVYTSRPTGAFVFIPSALWQAAPSELMLCPSVGYYYSAGTCGVCHSRCLRCSGPTYKDCQQCRSGCSLLTNSYQNYAANVCHCPRRMNVASGGGTALSLPGTEYLTGVSQFTIEVWAKLLYWGTGNSDLVDTCSVALSKANDSTLEFSESAVGRVPKGTVFFSGVRSWVHFAVAVSSSKTATVYRNAIQSLQVSLSAVTTPTCFKLGGSTSTVLFREARIFSVPRSQSDVEESMRYRLAAITPASLSVYFPLDETSGISLKSGLATIADYNGALAFKEDEDQPLTLCEQDSSYQVVVPYDNWWYCSGIGEAVQLFITDLSLPVATGMVLASDAYVLDFWVQLQSPAASAEVIEVGTAITIKTNPLNAFKLDLQVTGSTPATLTATPIAADTWNYVKVWVKGNQVQAVINNATPVSTTSTASDLSPTFIQIKANPDVFVAHLRLFKREITALNSVSPAFSLLHLGDLGLEDLVGDWPLDEGVGKKVYDHSVNAASVNLPLDAVWGGADLEGIQHKLSRTELCSSPNSCVAVTSLEGVRTEATNYLLCNAAGSTPTAGNDCESRWKGTVWHARSEQLYALKTALPAPTVDQGFEVSFWFAVNKFTQDSPANILSVGNTLQFLVRSSDSSFVVMAGSLTAVDVFHQAVTPQRWYSVRAMSHNNPPTLRLWIASKEVVLQVPVNSYSPIVAGSTLSFAKGTSVGFDGYILQVLFYSKTDFYRREILWSLGKSAQSSLTSDPSFTVFLDFEGPSSNAIANYAGDSVSLDGLADKSSVFETSSPPLNSRRPDACAATEYQTATTCAACVGACTQCSAGTASDCYKCKSGNSYYAREHNCVGSCPAGFTANGGECKTACFGSCLSNTCTGNRHFECGVKCADGLNGNGFGYCNGKYINPSASGGQVQMGIAGTMDSGFTLQFWALLVSLGTGDQSLADIGQYHITLNSDSTRIKVIIASASSSAIASPSVSSMLSTWLHISVSVTPAELQLVTFSQSSGAYDVQSVSVESGLYQSPSSLTLGGSSQRLNGFFAEVRVWNLGIDFNSDGRETLIPALATSYLNSLSANTVLYYPLVDGSGATVKNFDQSQSVSVTGAAWQTASVPLSLCPDTGHYYKSESGTRICRGKRYPVCDPRCLSCAGSAQNCSRCSGSLYLTLEYLHNGQPVYTCAATCDTNGFYSVVDSISRRCLPCDSKCQTCTGPGDYSCTACKAGMTLNANSAHKCGTQLINPSAASSTLSLKLPTSYSDVDAPYTVMLWFYGTFAAGGVYIVEATPWLFGVQSNSLLAFADTTSSTLTVATMSVSAGWHHFAFSMAASPLGMQLVLDGNYVAIQMFPAAFRRITGLYLGKNGTSGRFSGYITDLNVFNTALRATTVSLLFPFVIHSDEYLGMKLDVSYQLTEGSGKVVTGLINGDEKSVELGEGVWDTAPSVPTVCDPEMQYFDGTTCVALPSDCLLGANGGCLMCSGGKVAALDLLSCLNSCPSGQYAQFGRCSKCAYPCTACSADTGAVVCSACASGAPSGGVCPDASVDTLYFSSQNEFAPITVASQISASELTVELWARMEVMPAAEAVILTVGDLTLSALPAGLLKTAISGTVVDNSAALSASWKHFAVVISPTNTVITQRLQLYLDGTQQSLAQYTGQTFTFASVKLGTRRGLNCGMREVRIWGTARSLSSIQFDKDYTIPLSMSPLPTGLLAAISFTSFNNNGAKDLVSTFVYNFGKMYGFQPEAHIKNWAIDAVGSYLCDYTTSKYAAGGTCVPCDVSCKTSSHCVSGTTCQNCAYGYYSSGTVCEGLPALRKTTSQCIATNEVSYSTAMLTWTVELWVKPNLPVQSGENIVAVKSSTESLALTFSSAGSEAVTVKSALGGAVLTSTTSLSSQVWRHVALQSITLGAISRTGVLLDGVSVHSRFSPLPLTAILIGGSPTFTGLVRTLRVWTVWLESPQLVSYSKVHSQSFTGLKDEWSFASASSLLTTATMTQAADCLSKQAMSAVNPSCPVLNNFLTTDANTGLSACTNSCASNCSICSGLSRCDMCSNVTFRTTNCDPQKNVFLGSSSQVSWTLGSAVFGKKVVTVMAWVKIQTGNNTPVLKLVSGSNWLGVSVTSTLQIQVKYNSIDVGLTGCTATSLQWLHLALIIRSSGSTFGFSLYCDFQPASTITTTTPSTSFSSIVLGDSTMTSSRYIKLLKAFSADLPADYINAYGRVRGPLYPDLAFNAPLEPTDLTIYESISNAIITLSAAEILSEDYSLGVCDSGQRFVSSMCVPCNDTMCVLCQDVTSVCTTCKFGYFASSGVCVACSGNCYSCSGSASTCTSCVVNATLAGTVCACNTGFYPASGVSSLQCDLCHSSCLACSNGTNIGCLSCASTRTLVGTRCLLSGLFDTDAENAQYTQLCLSSGVLIQPQPTACLFFLKSYCCPSTAPLRAQCIAQFPTVQCRACSFDDSAVCDSAESLCWSSDWSVQAANDRCRNSIYAYCCAQHTPAADCSRMPYQFPDCGNSWPPGILSAVWSSSLGAFNLTFNATLDASQFVGTSCSNYFDPSNVTAFGQGAQCVLLESNKVLSATLGFSSTFSVESLSLLPYKFKTVVPFGYYANLTSIKVTLPAGVTLTPQAVIVAQARVSTCSDLVLDGLSSSGSFGRVMKYKWTVLSNVTNLGLEAEVTALGSYSSSGRVAVARKSLLAGSELKVTLSVVNAFGLENSTTRTVEVSGASIPAVAFPAMASYVLKVGVYYEFPVSVTASQCGGTPVSYDVRWSLPTANCSFDMSDFVSKMKNRLILTIFPYILAPGCSYTFSISATPVYSSGPGEAGAANITLSLPETPIRATIIGGDTQLSVNVDYSLDASRSTDPGQPGATLTFKWTRCSDADCVQVGSDPVNPITGGSLKAGVKYTYTVEIASGSRTARASRYIIATDAAVASLSILPLDKPLNPTSTNVISSSIRSATAVKMQWSVASPYPAVFSSPVDQPTVSIAPFSLTPGLTYQLQLLVTMGASSNVATLTAYVNSPPGGGSLTAAPLSGKDLDTTFQFLTERWSDLEGDLPIRYQFYRYDSETLSALTVLSIANTFASTLAQGSASSQYIVRMIVRAYDAYDAYSELSQYILVQPAFTTQAAKSAFALSLAETIRTSPSDLQYIPALVNSISESTFSGYQNSSADGDYATEREVYNSVVAVIDNWWKAQPLQNNTVGVVADCLNVATQAPAVLTSAEINSTLAVVEKITSFPLDSRGVQSVFQVLSNLDSANSAEESRKEKEQNVTQTDIRDYLLTTARAALQNNVRDESASKVLTANFNGYFQRIAPTTLQSMKVTVQSTQNDSSSAAVEMPPDGLQSLGLDPTFAIDVIVLVSKNKPNRGGYANSTAAQNYTEEYVAAAETVKVQFELSGSVNSYGEFTPMDRSELQVNHLDTPLNVSIPFKAASESAKATCAFLNVTVKKWDSSGCILVSINRTSNTALCTCNHLTEFSVSDVSDGAIAAGESANVDEAINIGALADINFTGNAVGLYLAIALLALYAALGVFTKRLDRKDMRELEEFYNDPQKNMADAISKNKDLYNIFVSGQGVSDLQVPKPPVPPDIIKTDQCDDPSEAALSQSALIYLNHYGLDMTAPIDASKLDFDFSKVQPAPARQYVFYEDRVVRTKRTCWELVVTNHVIFGLVFRVSSTFPRFARLTVFFCALFGKLFVTGFFYDSGSSKGNESEKDLSNIMNEYRWYDFFIAVMSALLTLPIVLLVTFLLKQKPLTDDMSEHRKEKVARRNKVRRVCGYVLAWTWMVACGIEITLFAIQFNVSGMQANASKLWVVTYSLSTLWDNLVAQFFQVFMKIGVMRFLYE